MEEDRAALEAFVLDNKELKEIENLTTSFNIFEAIGVIRQELRHSDFLRFLLDPSASHGLGDAFLSSFLKKALQEGEGEVGVIDIDVADFTGVEVRREWRNIDILIIDPRNKLAFLIENKIGTGEHSDQLNRYKEIVDKAFPEYRKVFLFLTPDGEPPSHDEYIPISYSDVRSAVEEVRNHRKSTIGPDVEIILRHYSEMIGGYIVSNSDIAELCQKIYRKHKRALDLILEHRPDIQMELSQFCQDLRSEGARTAGIIPGGNSSKVWISFSDKCLTDIESQAESLGWKDKFELFFEFDNTRNMLSLFLYISVHGHQDLRKTVWEYAKNNEDVFKNSHDKFNKGATHIYKRSLLTQADYEEPDMEKMTQKIVEGWNEFLEKDLPSIRARLAELKLLAPGDNHQL